MSEKDKLLENLAEKSGKSVEELETLVKGKIDELSGLVSEEGAIYIIANELGAKLESEKPKREVELKKIEEITEPKIPVSLVCKVIRKYNRVTFSSSSGSEGSVQSLLVGDESGITRIVFWNDKTELVENIHEGDIIKVINAYTRENNQNPDRIEVHYGPYSDIEVNPEGVEVKLAEFTPGNLEFTEKKISDLEEGDRNVKITAVVTDFEIPRFYFGCPECFKKVFQDEDVQKCAEHGEVTAMKVPIVNLVIDDGSGGVINVVGFRDRAENLTNSKSDDIIALTEDIEKYRDFSQKIIGSKLTLGGNIGLNNMTGEKQLLVNQVLGIESKSVDEIADDLVKEDSNNKKESQTQKGEKSEEKKPDSDDDLDLDVEEIDIDDDLL